MSYLKRKIDVTFQLGTGSFGESGFDTIKITGRRVSVSITKAGGAMMGESQFTIYGMLKEQMDALSTLGLIPQQMPEQRRNAVIIEAGDDENGMSTVYIGTVTNAYFNAQAAPEVSFVVLAHAGLIQALRPIPPTSIKGSVDVSTVMGDLAAQGDLDFEPNGVNIKLPTSYFKGAVRDQMKACADAAGINWTIDNGKLAIWPRPGERSISMPLVSPQNGMVGYPTFNAQGLEIVTLFNPGLVFGGSVQIRSSLDASLKTALGRADGVWYVYTLYHDLESELPNGKWFTRFLCSPPGYVPVTQ